MAQQTRYILSSSRAVNRQIALTAPRAKRADVDRNALNNEALCLKPLNTFNRRLLPLLKRIIKFVSVWNYGDQQVPLHLVVPGKSYDWVTIHELYEVSAMVPNA